MNSRLSLLPVLALALASAHAQSAQIMGGQLPIIPKVKIGDKAPSLIGAKWIKGTPVVSLGGGRVTVLEFWASWCPTCAETYGHVAELARKFHGQATFIGLSVWEHSDDVKSGAYIPKLAQFVTAKADQMPFGVAADDPQSTIANRWLGANSGDIPKTFVIDRSGRVAWCGHPLADDLDDTISSVIAGRFDMERAADEQTAAINNAQELIDMVMPIQQAVQARKWDAAVKAIDSAISRNAKLEAGLGPTKFQLMLRVDEPGAYAYARTLANGVCKDSYTALNLIAWTIVDDDSKLKNPDLSTALTLAKRAYELTDHEDPYSADTYSYALYKTGDKAKALEIQLKAVRTAQQTKGFDPKTLKDLRDRLALYRKQGP